MSLFATRGRRCRSFHFTAFEGSDGWSILPSPYLHVFGFERRACYSPPLLHPTERSAHTTSSERAHSLNRLLHAASCYTPRAPRLLSSSMGQTPTVTSLFFPRSERESSRLMLPAVFPRGRVLRSTWLTLRAHHGCGRQVAAWVRCFGLRA